MNVLANENNKNKIRIIRIWIGSINGYSHTDMKWKKPIISSKIISCIKKLMPQLEAIFIHFYKSLFYGSYNTFCNSRTNSGTKLDSRTNYHRISLLCCLAVQSA